MTSSRYRGYSLIGMCHAQRVGFLGRFGLKTGIQFAHFGLESDIVVMSFRGKYGNV